jgi:hypothetical protein
MDPKQTMDPIWKNLPGDLSEKICNCLPKVRAISPILKYELLYAVKMREFYMIFMEYEQVYGTHRAWDVILMDMYNILNEYNEEPMSQWLADNAFEPLVLFRAMSADQVNVLLLQI